MGLVCILTDGTAQFTCTEFPGYNFVKVVSFEPQPALLQPGGSSKPRLSGGTAEDFLNQFQLLGTIFQEIMVITVSSALSPVTWNVSQAVARLSIRRRPASGWDCWSNWQPRRLRPGWAWLRSTVWCELPSSESIP
jgi:hypothetical protein